MITEVSQARRSTLPPLSDLQSDVDPAYERGIRAVDAEGHEVRPAGWLDYHLVDVVVPTRTEDGYVELVWEAGSGLGATTFAADETVAVRR